MLPVENISVLAEIKQGLAEGLRAAAARARQKGQLEYEGLPSFVVEVPREKEHGDLASNCALVLAREARKPPRQVAEVLVSNFDRENTWVDKIEVAGPGFINFSLDYRWLYQALREILARQDSYGRSEVGRGRRIQVEFVSANPTGLLHMGNARGAALGDSIANLLEASGYEVTREFYINDAGTQVINLAKSIEARYLQLLGYDAVVPADGYHGEDLIDTARRIVRQVGSKYLDVEPELRRELMVQFVLEEKLAAIKKSLERFGVHYDVWFSESSLHESGEVARVISELEEKGYVYERDGALWFRATAFGEDKDEVMVRANGLPTYFAADVAYHKNKFERGFDRVVNIWGADHHGHVARLKGALRALGYDPERLIVIIMQLVRLYQGGELVRMSKRTGQYVTLDELVEEVGVDAARYFFVMRSAESHLEFDLDLAKRESSENPVYYVQYAHARIASIMRHAAELGYKVPSSAAEANFGLLTHPSELDLIRRLADFPEVVKGAAEALEPHRLPKYAGEVAGLFHVFYTNCRVLTEEKDLREARLLLAKAVKIVLANLLRLLGVSAPEKM